MADIEDILDENVDTAADILAQDIEQEQPVWEEDSQQDWSMSASPQQDTTTEWAEDFKRIHGRAPDWYDKMVVDEMTKRMKPGQIPSHGDWERLTLEFNSRGIYGPGKPEFVPFDYDKPTPIPGGSPWNAPGKEARWNNFAYWEKQGREAKTLAEKQKAQDFMRASVTANAPMEPWAKVIQKSLTDGLPANKLDADIEYAARYAKKVTDIAKANGVSYSSVMSVLSAQGIKPPGTVINDKNYVQYRTAGSEAATSATKSDTKPVEQVGATPPTTTQQQSIPIPDITYDADGTPIGQPSTLQPIEQTWQETQPVYSDDGTLESGGSTIPAIDNTLEPLGPPAPPEEASKFGYPTLADIDSYSKTLDLTNPDDIEKLRAFALNDQSTPEFSATTPYTAENYLGAAAKPSTPVGLVDWSKPEQQIAPEDLTPENFVPEKAANFGWQQKRDPNDILGMAGDALGTIGTVLTFLDQELSESIGGEGANVSPLGALARVLGSPTESIGPQAAINIIAGQTEQGGLLDQFFQYAGLGNHTIGKLTPQRLDETIKEWALGKEIDADPAFSEYMQYPDVQQVYKEQGPRAAFEYAEAKYDPYGMIGRFGRQALLDPTNALIGTGILSKAAQGLSAIPKVGKTVAIPMKALAAIDEAVFNIAPQKTFELLGKGYRMTPLGKTTTEGKFNRTGSEIIDAGAELSRHGAVAADFLPIDPTFGISTGNKALDNDAEKIQHLALNAKIKTINDPILRALASSVKSLVAEGIFYAGQKAASRALALLPENKAKLLENLPEAELLTDAEIFAMKHRDSMQYILAGDKTIDKLLSEGITTTPLSPAASQQIHTAIDTATKTINTIVYQARRAEKAARQAAGDNYNDPTYRAVAARIYEGANKAKKAAFDTIAQTVEQVTGKPIPQSSALLDLTKQFYQIQASQAGLDTFLPLMSKTRAPVLQATLLPMSHYIDRAQADKTKLLNIIGTIATRARIAAPELTKSEDVAKWLQKMNSDGKATDMEFNTAKALMQRWVRGHADLLNSDYITLSMKHLLNDKAKAMGVEPSSGFWKYANLGLDLWKSIALLSPRYHTQNMVSQWAMSGLAGVNPAEVMYNQASALSKMLRNPKGTPQQSSIIRKAMEEWEMTQLPDTLTEFFNLFNYEPLLKNEKGELAIDRIFSGTKGRAMLGAIGSFLGLAAGPVGMGVSASGAMVLPKLLNWSQALTRGLEEAARSSAWHQGKLSYMKGTGVPDLIKNARIVLGQQRLKAVEPQQSILGRLATEESGAARISDLLGTGKGKVVYQGAHRAGDTPIVSTSGTYGPGTYVSDSAEEANTYANNRALGKSAAHSKITAQEAIDAVRKLREIVPDAEIKTWELKDLTRTKAERIVREELRKVFSQEDKYAGLNEVTRKIDLWLDDIFLTRQIQGQNIRPIYLPEDMRFLDADNLQPNEARRILQESNIPEDAVFRFGGGVNNFWQSLMLHHLDKKSKFPSAPKGFDTDSAVAHLAEEMTQRQRQMAEAQTQRTLHEAGYDGIKFRGSNYVIFQDSLPKVRNAITGEEGGSVLAGPAVDLGTSAASAVAGYATAPEDSTEKEKLTRGAAFGLGGLGASRAVRSGQIGLSVEDVSKRIDIPRTPREPGPPLIIRDTATGKLNPDVDITKLTPTQARTLTQEEWEVWAKDKSSEELWDSMDSTSAGVTMRDRPRVNVGQAARPSGFNAPGNGTTSGGNGGGNVPPTIPPSMPPIGEPFHRWSQSQIDSVIKAIKSTNGMLGEKKLTKILQDNNIDDPEVIQPLTKILTDHLAEGDIKGEQKAEKIHFNYGVTDELEKSLKWVFPFIIWAKRAMPFFAQSAWEHPGLLLALNRFNNLSEQDTKNLPPRFKGQLSAGKFGRRVADALGFKGNIMINPFEAIMPFSDTNISPQGDSAIEKGIKTAGNFGFGSAPWVQMPAIASGAFGYQGLPNFLRQNNMFRTAFDYADMGEGKGLTGNLADTTEPADVERFWKDPLERILKNQGIDLPDSSIEWKIRRRILEKSWEETGTPQHPKYMAVLQANKGLGDKNSVIWKEATDDVKNLNKHSTWVNFGSPMFVNTLSDTEAYASRASAGKPKYSVKGDWLEGFNVPQKSGGMNSKNYISQDKKTGEYSVVVDGKELYSTPDVESANSLFKTMTLAKESDSYIPGKSYVAYNTRYENWDVVVPGYPKPLFFATQAEAEAKYIDMTSNYDSNNYIADNGSGRYIVIVGGTQVMTTRDLDEATDRFDALRGGITSNADLQARGQFGQWLNARPGASIYNTPKPPISPAELFARMVKYRNTEKDDKSQRKFFGAEDKDDWAQEYIYWLEDRGINPKDRNQIGDISMATKFLKEKLR